MNTQQPSRPVITPAMREQAKKQPNTWLYVVDPIFTDPNAEVPPWGFIGGYRVDEHGEITDDFSPNPNYRPSPVALRLPAPKNDVERALQLTTTGYAQGQALLAAMLDAELILFAQPQGTGLFTMEHESGRRQLQVFTSEGFLPPNWTTWQRMTGRQVATHPLAGIDLQINPTSPVKARMPGEDLVAVAASVPPKPPAVPMSPPAGTPMTPGPPASPPTGTTTSPPSGTAMSPPAGTAVPGTGSDAPTKTVRVGPGGPAAPPAPAAPAPAEAVEAEEPAEAGGSEFEQRFLGAVLAGAIGDALGAPVEFYPIDQIRSRFGEDGVTEYDRSGEHPGEFTDDTQLALFTLEGLIRAHSLARSGDSAGPLPAVQLAYQRWLHTQGYAWMRSAGPFAAKHPKANGWLVEQTDLFAVRSPNSTTISALREFASVGAPGTFERPINDSDDCGGVVRAAPVALWSDDPRSVFELAAATAALTHSQPNAYLPAGVLAVLVHRLLREESLTEALETARELLTAYRDHEDTARALRTAEELAQKGKPTPEELRDALGSGWAGHEALAIAVCAARCTETVADALMVAINHSGDSDSTGAICGNIVGAQHGTAALPGVWLRDLGQREVVEALAKDGLLEFRGAPPTGDAWAKRYPASGDVSDLDFASSLPRAEAEEVQEPTEDEDEPAADPAPEVESVVSPPESATPPPPSSPEDLRTQRILGMLLGTAAGDALGFPIEADTLTDIRAKFGDSGLIDYVDGHRPAGSISDETQLTAFTTEGLVRAATARRQTGSTDPAVHVQQAYQRWLHTQGVAWSETGGRGEQPDGWLIGQRELFDRRVRGMTTVQALRGHAGGQERGSLEKPPNDAADWGAVVRAAPAALWSEDPAEAFRTGVRTAVLTHGHVSAYLPAGALALLVHQLLANRSLPQAVDRALLELSEWDGHEETITALRKAVELAATGTPTPEQIEEAFGTAHSGAQVLAIAVCAALTHPESFPEALVLAANHSGASDSTASICGGIMGAAHTAAAIPQHWQEKLELRETLEFLAADADLEFGSNPPSGQLWAARYPVPEEEPAPEEPAEEASAPQEAEAAEAVVEADPEPDEEQAPADQAPTDQAPTDEGSTDEGSTDEAEQTAAQHESAGHVSADEDTVDAATERTPVAALPAEESPADDVPASAESEDSGDEGLSDEELRLLLAWRKFRDNDDGGNSADLTQGLHKLLVEAFGEERAAQLIGEATAEEDEPAEEPELEAAEERQVRPTRRERFTGCVLGAAVGDALGAPWMFSDLLTTLRENPDGVREYAELFGRRGTATAYTQQTAFVLAGLNGPNPDRPSLVRASLRDWVRTQGGRPMPDGGGKLAQVEALRAQRFPDEATLTAVARWGDRSENPTPGNPPNDARNAAATARGAVVGFEVSDPAEAITLGIGIGVLTHGHPDGHLPAAALAGLVSGIDGGRTLVDSVEFVLAELDRVEGAENTVRGLRAALEIATGGPVSPTVLESLGLGWNAPEALAIAVAAALSHPTSVADAISLAATHAGNSAATAAICGALVGTARGAGELPEEWVGGLELREVLEQLLGEVEIAETEVPEPAVHHAG
ncbi:type VII secretion system-associated protein [Saccharopolyspora rhizosphaerae]|uniref:Type VII secretion system-associated protein n=1 Tax=Saccharopolyspora rhizosphaerae TaxID=2492662 RepID=A0A3R8QES4_9PSEU|nr:type VII secretion system-associated protein [Saccharopolyspora rhizosphaerae]RRO19301.1 type VII secretion system-associated protein [Saccharopolyspora rhizosphaerae]